MTMQSKEQMQATILRGRLPKNEGDKRILTPSTFKLVWAQLERDGFTSLGDGKVMMKGSKVYTFCHHKSNVEVSNV